MDFPQRIGKRPVKETVQLDGIDNDLRTSLWNVFYIVYITGEYLNDRAYHFSDEVRARLYRSAWFNFFKSPLDQIPYKLGDTDNIVKKWFLDSEWLDVYRFIEFIIHNDLTGFKTGFKKLCNQVLEREISGYRIIDDIVVPITNTNELGEIDEALKASISNGLSGVSEHLKAALSMLSDRKNPDYRNSIKESISAVESIAKLISGDDKAELGKALNKLDEKLSIHPALKKGFLSIYGYTSDEGGIRHAMLVDSPTIDFEDAKYMLVSCSAFVNYLIAKSAKAGINF